ncbi:MAG: nuclear transport factor 2 family protein [Dehalococcoidales bacterium]
MEKPVTDVVKQFLKAEDQLWNTGDGDALLAIEDPNIVVHMFNVPAMKGNTAHVNAVKGIRNGLPGTTHVWADITGSGDIGAFRYTEKFKLGEKEVAYDGCMFLHVKDGKVIEIYAQYDSLTLNKALGRVQDVPK